MSTTSPVQATLQICKKYHQRQSLAATTRLLMPSKVGSVDSVQRMGVELESPCHLLREEYSELRVEKDNAKPTMGHHFAVEIYHPQFKFYC